jgi:hypothetical protein
VKALTSWFTTPVATPVSDAVGSMEGKQVLRLRMQTDEPQPVSPTSSPKTSADDVPTTDSPAASRKHIARSDSQPPALEAVSRGLTSQLESSEELCAEVRGPVDQFIIHFDIFAADSSARLSARRNGSYKRRFEI